MLKTSKFAKMPFNFIRVFFWSSLSNSFYLEEIVVGVFEVVEFEPILKIEVTPFLVILSFIFAGNLGLTSGRCVVRAQRRLCWVSRRIYHKAGHTLIVSRISTCSCTFLWTILCDCEPVTIHFSQYHRFCSSLILWETCPIVLFGVLWKYRSPGENGEMQDEKNDWWDGLRNAIYTLLGSLVLPTFFHILVNLRIRYFLENVGNVEID